jgi:hypothetical protein
MVKMYVQLMEHGSIKNIVRQNHPYLILPVKRMGARIHLTDCTRQTHEPALLFQAKIH